VNGETLQGFNDVLAELTRTIDPMTPRQPPVAATVALLTALAASLFAAPARMTSAAASKMTIDGHVDEWPQLEPIEETHVSAAAQNDVRNLYLMIATSDQARRRQMLTSGLAIWFDAEGGKKQRFGIRVPGMMPSFAGVGRRGGGGGGGGGMRPAPPPADPADVRSLPAIEYVEILGPGKDDRRRLELSATKAIQVARSQDDGTLTLELQVPLQKNDASEFAIGARPGGVIGLGLETPKMERPEGGPPGGPGGHPGGGMGGMGGGGGRGGGGGMGGMGGGMGGMGGGRGGHQGGPGGPDGHMERADPLKYWTTVQLATGEATQPNR